MDTSAQMAADPVHTLALLCLALGHVPHSPCRSCVYTLLWVPQSQAKMMGGVQTEKSFLLRLQASVEICFSNLFIPCFFLLTSLINC